MQVLEPREVVSSNPTGNCFLIVFFKKIDLTSLIIVLEKTRHKLERIILFAMKLIDCLKSNITIALRRIFLVRLFLVCDECIFEAV